MPFWLFLVYNFRFIASFILIVTVQVCLLDFSVESCNNNDLSRHMYISLQVTRYLRLVKQIFIRSINNVITLQMFSNMLRSALTRGFSTTATALQGSSKIYELRIYSFKPTNAKTFIEKSRVAMPTRYKHSTGVGYFFSEIGGLGESVHIWEYGN